MTYLDERRSAAEIQHAQDEMQRFRELAAQNRKLCEWVGQRMAFDPEAATAYAGGLFLLDESTLFKRLISDLADRDIILSEADLQSKRGAIKCG